MIVDKTPLAETVQNQRFAKGLPIYFFAQCEPDFSSTGDASGENCLAPSMTQ